MSGRYWNLGWPEAWPIERIESKYLTTGSLEFARMMLLDLKATEGVVLKQEWLHEYPADSVDPSWPVVFGVDYTSTVDKLKNKDNDYFALAILRAIPGGGLVLVDGRRAHVSKGEALAAVFSYWGIYPTLKKVGVESIAEGRAFYNDLLLSQDAGGRMLPLFEIHGHSRSKGIRFEKYLAPRFELARIWITNTPNEFVTEFRNEWLMYDNAEHDDCLDAVYMAVMAAENFMPSKAERTVYGKKRKKRTSAWSALGDQQKTLYSG